MDIVDIIVDIMGSNGYGFIIWNLVYWLVNAATKYKKDTIVVLVWSFVISFIFTIVGGWLWYPPALLFNAPIILLFFLYDFIKANKNKKEKAAPLN